MLRVLFLILVLMSSIAFAQKQKPQAFKFDEFTQLQESEWKQRLERFSEMQKSMPNSALYVILYVEKEKARNSVDNLGRQYLDCLVKSRGIDPVKVSLTVGGFRKQQTTELWIVPEKADSPKATPDEEFKAEKFAEIGVISDEELKLKMDEFDKETNKNPSDTGYIITYGTEKEIAKREKLIRDSIRSRRYDSTRIVLMSHNDGENLRTVFWLVPAGAEPPTP